MILLTSIIYIVIYHILLIFSNILLIEYIYPYISNMINRYLNFITNMFNNYSINYNNTSNYELLYDHHNKYKDKLNNKKIYEDVNIHLLSLLTCPICYNLYDKIYICPNGHSLCHKCYSSSNICSFCRIEINNNTRNRALEEIVENIQLPCSYYKYGCSKFILNIERNSHENRCCFKPIKCKIDNCIYQSNYEDMKKHINNEHFNINIIQNKSDINYKFNLTFNINQYIKFDKNLITSLNSDIFSILDTGKFLIFVKWFISGNTNYSDNINEYYSNKKISFTLLSEKNNNFSIDVYNKEEKKFGKYTMLNKLKNIVNNCNTISIPLSSLYYIKDSNFNIDVTIYKRNKKKI